MATLYSKADLRNRALIDISVLAAGESPPADMIAVTDPIMQQMIESLDDENVLIFDPSTSVSTQVIPARVMRAMAALLAWELAPGFGVQRGERESLVNALRRHVLQGSDPTPVEFTSY
jgi:hypothetical protein